MAKCIILKYFGSDVNNIPHNQMKAGARISWPVSSGRGKTLSNTMTGGAGSIMSSPVVTQQVYVSL